MSCTPVGMFVTFVLHQLIYRSMFHGLLDNINRADCLSKNN